MTQKSIDINEFSNITLLASETLNSINLTKYQDHSEMLDKILQRMEAFDTMKDIQTTHGYVIDTHRNLLEMTRGIVENFDALKEEFRNKLLEFLNSILSIIAITAAIDYIAPVFSWNDELKLIVLVAFVILFTTTSQLYYFLKRRKISFW